MSYLALAADSLGLHGNGLSNGATDPQFPGDAGVGPSQRHHGQEVVEHHQHGAVAATPRATILVGYLFNAELSPQRYWRGQGSQEVGGRGVCLTLHCHYHGDSCIQMGSDERLFLFD